jgi:2-methylisocitrate lyase-like PEP mutase family enzyme
MEPNAECEQEFHVFANKYWFTPGALAASVDVPISGDLENGFGDAP